MNREKVNERLTGIMVLAILFVFPLIYKDYYFDISVVKYWTYCIIVVVTLFVWFISFLVLRKVGFQKKKESLKIPERAVLLFLCICLISTLCSSYRYEAFWGNEGRFCGLFLMSLYAAEFLLIIRFFKFKKWYLDIFLCAGFLVCALGITDYFQMDLLGFKEQMQKKQLNMFASTIGNINIYTAYIGMFLGVAMNLFAVSRKKGMTLFYFISMLVGFFAIIMGTSDNAYLALGILFAGMPCYLFKTKTGVKRYVLMLASFFSVLQCIDFINIYMGDVVLGIEGAFNILIQLKGLPYIVIGLWGGFLLACLLEYKGIWKTEDMGRRTVSLWCFFLAVVILVVMFILYDANFGGHAERYDKLKNYLVFSDAWGNYRGVAWRLGLEEFSKFSILKKLIGYGPDTFGILMVTNCKKEMTTIAAQIYDSAHNEYLQYLITTGILGLASYMVLIGSSLKLMLRKMRNIPELAAVAFAVLAYLLQAAVNIALPITTPIFITLLAMGVAACRETDESDIKEV